MGAQGSVPARPLFDPLLKSCLVPARTSRSESQMNSAPSRPERYNVRVAEAKWRKAWADADVVPHRQRRPAPEILRLDEMRRADILIRAQPGLETLFCKV